MNPGSEFEGMGILLNPKSHLALKLFDREEKSNCVCLTQKTVNLLISMPVSFVKFFYIRLSKCGQFNNIG